MKWRLFFANFFQVFPFCLVLVHGVYLRAGINNEFHYAIVVSMGLYSALQVGGIWLISWLPRRTLTDPHLWIFLRVLGCIFYLIDNSIFIILGAGFLGLSQALFYRFSRKMVSNYWKNDPDEAGNVYTLMALALNISFLILPITGAALVKHISTPTIMFTAMLFSILGVLLIRSQQEYWIENEMHDDIYQISPNENTNNSTKSNLNFRELILDIYYLGSFVVPYGIMMALIPLKSKTLGLSIDTNGKLFSLNAFIVISILLVKTFFLKAKLSNIDLTKNLSLISAFAWVLTLLSAFASLNWLIFTFVLWSLLEALQLPTIEKHLFFNRQYTSKWLDRILVVDAFGSFTAPLLASMLISLQGILL